MRYPVCDLLFTSPFELEKVGELISQNLFGGIPFVGREKYIYDEVPAIFLEHQILGLRIILHGYGGKEGYSLEMLPRHHPPVSEYELVTESARIDITDYIAFLLQDIEGIEIREVGSEYYPDD